MIDETWMILIKGKDKTSEISAYEMSSPYVKIQFHHSTTVYTYPMQQVQVLQATAQEVITDEMIVFCDDMPFNNVRQVLYFGSKARVCYINGINRTYDAIRIKVKCSTASSIVVQKALEYWKEIAHHTKIVEYKEAFLARQFASLTYIDPDSALSRYMHRHPIEAMEQASDVLIFPFRYNLSQRASLELALTRNISVIEGPPGTGKTQTILNLLANLTVMQGKKVAVVSSNNAAVQNVREKLERYGYHFLAASLGNKENRQRFFANPPRGEVSEWRSTIPEEELIGEIIKLDQRIQSLMEQERQLAELKQQRAAYLLEQEHFEHYFTRRDIEPMERLSFYRQTSKDVLEFMKDNFLAVEMKKKYRYLYIFKLFFKHGFTHFKRLKLQHLDVILNVQRTFYRLRIEELSASINQLEKALAEHNYDSLRDQHQHYSVLLMRHKLYESYADRPEASLDEKNYTSPVQFKRFLEQYPIVLSTTHSLRSCIPANYLFDYCIIDEASQVDLLTGALALSCCKQVVIVGDTKQLPHIVDQSIQQKLKSQDNVQIEDTYNYFKHNLISSMLALYNDSLPKVMLREHYRCHPRIIEFCNRKYYNGELIVYTDSASSQPPLLIYRTAAGNHMRQLTHGTKGKYNARELAVIQSEVMPSLMEAAAAKEEVGFVTPYRKQVEKAVQQFEAELESDTVHKYQGREKEVMMMSTVLDRTRAGSEGMNFVSDPRMINVAVSRAQKQFILVTDHSAFRKYGNEVGDLMRYMEYSTLDNIIVESQVLSVFDLLYKEYSDALRGFRERVRFFNASRHYSENIMHALIEQLLKEPQWCDFELGNQVLLANLFPDLGLLDEEERRFVRSTSSVDFVIYHKLDRSVAAAIEVDGFAFHENNPEQLRRDEIKDRIFSKYGKRLERFPTNGHQEESRLRSLLHSILRD